MLGDGDTYLKMVVDKKEDTEGDGEEDDDDEGEGEDCDDR